MNSKLPSWNDRITPKFHIHFVSSGPTNGFDRHFEVRTKIDLHPTVARLPYLFRLHGRYMLYKYHIVTWHGNAKGRSQWT